MQSLSKEFFLGSENEAVKCSAAQLKYPLQRNISAGYSQNLERTFWRILYCSILDRLADDHQSSLTSEEIHEHVSECLEVVSPGLLLAEVRVDAHVPGSARQALVLPVRNVLVRV